MKRRFSSDATARHGSDGGPSCWLLLLLAPSLSIGCVEDNPLYCIDDEVCRSRAAADPAVGSVCHPVGHFCHAGCSDDDDCQDPRQPGFSPDRPSCDTERRHCVAAGSLPPDAGPPVDGAADGGDDGGRKKEGATCDDGDECASSFCSRDGVCCDRACTGLCEVCPTGVCQRRAAGSSCGETRCEEGRLIEQRCTADGQCTARESSCGGYTCTASGESCRDSCDQTGGCLGGFECIEEQCHSTLENGEECGDNHLACASRHCVDGYCCAEADCPDCLRCDKPGEQGTCQPREAGPAPLGECPGDSVECGAGLCDGEQGCAYAAVDSSCGQPACGGGGPYERIVPLCDGAGSCSKALATSCGFALCQAGECLDGCADGGDCIPGSLCDRGEAHAHPQGRGECVEPDRVVTPAAGETLAQAIERTSAAKPYVAVAPGNHAGSITVTGATVALIGTGATAAAVVIEPSSSGVPALRVQGLGTLRLQGVKIQGATNDAAGVQCSGGAQLTLIESVVTTNAGPGVDTDGCDVVLRRDRIRLNPGGGARLEGGSLTVVNNLVTNNGAAGLSNLGGLWLAPTGGQLVFSNNTVANNVAQDDVAAGVICGGTGLVLHNAIVWYDGSIAHQGCGFAHSNVEGGVPPGSDNKSAPPAFVDPAGGDYALAVGSPSTDAGDPAAPGVGSIDLAGNPRVAGGDIDQGALEQ